MGLLDKYISETDFNKEVLADTKFTTDKIVVPDRDFLIAECVDALLRQLERNRLG